MENEKIDSFQKWISLMVVVIGTFMAILDSSIVNIAIPKMMAVFGVSTDEIQWVLTAYMLAMGSVIPLTGYLGDRFGNKNVYIWSLAMFTVGSALCGFAWSNSSMIIFRIIQALGGGMIMPVSMAIIYQIIPHEERGTALGIWGIAAMAAPSIGPTLSGYIVEHLDWRLIFTINIPVGVVGVILALILLEDFPRKPAKGFDLLGFVTSALGLSCILYVLGEGSSIDWGEFRNVFLMMTGVFSLILFMVNELTCDDPLLDLRVLKNFHFSLSILISSATTMALYGGVFILPLFLQNLQGYTAMQTGLLMFPGAVATGITMPIGGKLFDKFGAKLVVIPGLVLLAATTFELSKITADTSSSSIVLLMVLRGIGMGLCMMPATTAGMNTVPPQLVGRASALSNVVRQVAGSISITIITTVMQNSQTLSYARLAEQVNLFNPNSMQLVKSLQSVVGQYGLSGAEAQAGALSIVGGLVQKQAFVQSVQDTLYFTFLIALATIFLGFLIKDKKAPVTSDSQQHVMMD